MTESNEYKQYVSLSLEDVAVIAQNGDVTAIEYIVSRFGAYISGLARSYFLQGAENEDLYQEGMIGLIKAIRDFSPEKNASFKTFAQMCIKRQIITAIKSATRKKHIPLNSYVSLYNDDGNKEDSTIPLLDTIEDSSSSDPMKKMIHREELEYAKNMLNELLSDFEYDVLYEYLNGKSYNEIALKFNKQPKAVDNAIQRIKKKVQNKGFENIL
ncbi:MAG: RNA polymerase sporulation sigma factor SigH [Clostridiales bacterium]|nr:RNA polymerase sporulation sigma factor SigH [Clostridiales bacterium]